MKQTAVEWLVEQLAKNGILHSSDINQAKAMEKEQIKKCFIDVSDVLLKEANAEQKAKIEEAAEQYYNETFKK